MDVVLYEWVLCFIFFLKLNNNQTNQSHWNVTKGKLRNCCFIKQDCHLNTYWPSVQQASAAQHEGCSKELIQIKHQRAALLHGLEHKVPPPGFQTHTANLRASPCLYVWKQQERGVATLEQKQKWRCRWVFCWVTDIHHNTCRAKVLKKCKEFKLCACNCGCKGNVEENGGRKVRWVEMRTWRDGGMDEWRDTYCCKECRSRRAGADRERSEAPSSFALLLSLSALFSYVLRSLISPLFAKNFCFLIRDKKAFV